MKRFLVVIVLLTILPALANAGLQEQEFADWYNTMISFTQAAGVQQVFSYSDKHQAFVHTLLFEAGKHFEVNKYNTYVFTDLFENTKKTISSKLPNNKLIVLWGKSKDEIYFIVTEAAGFIFILDNTSGSVSYAIQENKIENINDL